MPDTNHISDAHLVSATDFKISRAQAWRVIGVFVLLVLGPVLVDHAMRLSSSGNHRAFWIDVFAPPSFDPGARSEKDKSITGHIRWLERGLDDATYSRSTRQFAQMLLTSVVREGNRKTHVGGGGWLFYQPELTALRGLGPMRHDAVSPALHDKGRMPSLLARDVVLEFAAQLKSRGIPLLLVPVPGKATIYPEFVSRLIRKPLLHRDQLALYDQFRAAGIDVLDLTATMWDMKIHKQIFLQQDTHWTPDAMEAMTEIIAKHIKKSYPQAVKPADVSELIDARPADRSSEGDLVRLLDLAAPEWVFPEEEALIVSRTGLDPSDQSPLALLGDSFVNIFDDPSLGFATEDEAAQSTRIRGGLAHKLAVILNQRLDVITANGGGATDVRRELARRSDDNVRGKKLVLWIIASRDLLLTPAAARDAGVTWERVEFNTRTSDGSTAAAPATSQQIVIEAELISKSKNQDPNAAPYLNALHVAEYKLKRVVSGEFKAADWLALQWTFKNKQLQPPASASPGKTYRLSLIPEATMPTEARNVNVSDDFTDRFTSERWYVEKLEEIR